MKTNNNMIIKAIEWMSYMFVTHLSYYLSFLIRYKNNYFEENIDAYMKSAPFISIAVLIFVASSGYLNMIKKSIGDIVIMTIGLSSAVAVSTIFIAFYARSFAFPRMIAAIGFVIMIFTFGLTKYLFIKLIFKFRKRRKVAIIVPSNIENSFINRTAFAIKKFDDIKYIIHEDHEELLSLVGRVEKVIIAEKVKSVMKDKITRWGLGKDISVYIVPTIYEVAQMNARLDQIVDIPIYKIDKLVVSKERLFAKRVFDLFFGSIFLVISAPVILVFGILVKLQDGGKSFYVQKRLSADKKEFNVIKLRTMVENAEEKTGAIFATTSDVRITKLGSFMRKHRIDELPQFVNVVKGDMSIVGPRPERPEFVFEFMDNIEGFEHRFLTKAGITGLAQVLGDYNTSASEKLKYDIIYLRNANVLFDLKMIFLTIKVVLIGVFYNKDDFEIDFINYLKKMNIKAKKKPYGYELENR